MLCPLEIVFSDWPFDVHLSHSPEVFTSCSGHPHALHSGRTGKAWAAESLLVTGRNWHMRDFPISAANTH